ncbi:MAG TPA: Ku protein [Propionibacteriaceae bacterium]|nr:Ku protein [Propionibacteriaceae bacterium]
MPRSIWKGAISFGLVSIPVRVFSGTEEKDISFHQVHIEDGGRIRYKRVCETDGQEVPYSEIGKGYDAADGRMVILDKDDFDNLPLPTTKTVDVVEFVSQDQVDPILFEKSYYLEAEGAGGKPYVLLRDALVRTGKWAVVKVALRNRESLAVIRPVNGVLVMHTMLWPDEVRDSSFAAPSADIKVNDAEVSMAEMFISQLEADFDPGKFTDAYREALETLVQQKLEGVPVPETAEAPTGQGEVIDLVAALRASVEAARKRRAEAEPGQPDAGTPRAEAS